MGLCLITKSKSWHSSYSYIHLLRHIFIKATLSYIQNLEYHIYPSLLIQCPFDLEMNKEKLEQQGPFYFDNEKKQLIQFLNQLLIPSSKDIPYQSQPCPWTPYSLYYFGLGGLKNFVYHSDCDGYYSPGDILNILELYSRIKNEIVIEDKDLLTSMNQLIDLFQDAFDSKSYITFC